MITQAQDPTTKEKRPKVLMFDIGGVCVLSPFQAILDTEARLNIPHGWINHSISLASPDGWWHRLERGEIPLDEAFFTGFSSDLHDRTRWRDFWLSRYASTSTTITAPPSPTAVIENDADIPPLPTVDAARLFHDIFSRARTPDPWMVPALHRLRDRYEGFFVLAGLSNTVAFPRGHALRYHAGVDEEGEEDNDNDDVAPSFLLPASPCSSLHDGKAKRKKKKLFDVFVSSAHVSLRKPDPRVYELAVRNCDEFALSEALPAPPKHRTERGAALLRSWGLGGEGGLSELRETHEQEQGQGATVLIKAQDVVFLDDIGENLRSARKLGMRTIKVPLGRAYEAVEELERITGLELLVREEEGGMLKVPLGSGGGGGGAAMMRGAKM